MNKTSDNQTNKKEFFLILFSLLLATVLVVWAFSINPEKNSALLNEKQGKAENVAPLSANDHIMGNPNAPVKLIEFSDPECAFCKKFHPTMTKIIKGPLGKSGQVAWVYRHFPVDSVHSKARIEAEATECAEQLGGQDSFWKYLDRLFEITPSNDNLDLKELPKIAEYVGLDRKKFEKCLSEMKWQDKIESQFQDGLRSGVVGTPYNIVVTNKGEYFTIPGAYPYGQVKATLKAILEGKMPSQQK